MTQSDDAANPGATTTAMAALIWSIALFGTLSVLTRAQLERLFGG